MVQSASRFRLCDTLGGDSRHFRAHGNAPPLRHDGIAPRPVRTRALWPRPQGLDGGRGPAGERTARSGIALGAHGVPLLQTLNRAVRLAAVLLIVAWALALPSARAAGQDTIEIVTRTGVHAFSVELATNTAERAVGLMFRKEMPEGHGMLFDFHDE